MDFHQGDTKSICKVKHWRCDVAIINSLKILSVLSLMRFTAWGDLSFLGILFFIFSRNHLSVNNGKFVFSQVMGLVSSTSFQTLDVY